MQDAENLVKLVDKSTVEGESYMKRRLVICYILQFIPWIIYTIILLLMSFVNIIIQISAENTNLLQFIRYFSLLSLIIISFIGLFIAHKNLPPAINTIFFLVFITFFSTASVGYFSLQFVKNAIIYGYAVLLPF